MADVEPTSADLARNDGDAWQLAEAGRRVGRRRLMRAGLAAVPAVLFTLRSHPAWGQGQVQMSTATSPYKLSQMGMTEEEVEDMLEQQRQSESGNASAEEWWADAPAEGESETGDL